MSDWYGTHSTVPAANAGLDLEMPGPAQWFGSHLADAVRAGDVARRRARRQGAADAVAARPHRRARHARLRPRAVDRRSRRPRGRAPGRDRELRAAAATTTRRCRSPAARGRRHPAAARGDRSERRGRDDPRRRERTRVAVPAGHAARRTARALRRRVPGRARARLLELQADAGARRDRARRPAAGRLLRRAASAAASRCSSSPATAAGSRSPGRSRPRCPRSSRCASRARWSRPRPATWTFGLVQIGRARLDDRRRGRGRQLGADRAQRGVHGLRERRGHRDHRPRGRRASRARGRVRARGPVDGRAGDRVHTARRRPICSTAPSRSRRAPTRSCAWSAPTATGRPRATIASRWRCRRRRTSSIRALAAVNPRTVVVVNAASPVAMDWADDVGAVLQCWFAGEEWGHALADVLSGDVNPSGKLPTTIPDAHRGHARVHELSGRARPGSLRRGRVRRLPVVRRRGASRRASASATGSRTRRSRSTRRCVATTRAERRRAARRRARSRRRPVRNTGGRRGAEVVQCYVRDAAGVGGPPGAGAEGVRQGVARSRRRGRGDARARSTRVRVLGRRRRRLGRRARRVRAARSVRRRARSRIAS